MDGKDKEPERWLRRLTYVSLGLPYRFFLFTNTFSGTNFTTDDIWDGGGIRRTNGACPKSHTKCLKTEFIAAKEANPNDPIFNQFQMVYEANVIAE
jgi:hypothetical protein